MHGGQLVSLLGLGGALVTSRIDRTSRGKTHQLVSKHTRPPTSDMCSADSTQLWAWLTIELMASPAFRTLSGNGLKAFMRLMIENVSHASRENGKLKVTHNQFVDHGVTGEYVADALDELQYKGLIRIKRGRAGDGTAHPNIYRLTFIGDWEGAPATHEWKRCTVERCREWSETERKKAKLAREKLGRKKKTSLGNPEMPSLRNPEMRKAS